MIFQNSGIFGFDVSHYQDNDNTPQGIDFEMMKAYGASFVIVKAGQLKKADSDFSYNWKHAKEAGIPRSSYWFCDIASQGKYQARYYWELMKNDVGEGMLFADFETGSWTDWKELYNFITELQLISGLPNEKIGVYSNYYYWTEHAPRNEASLNWFKKYPFWIASYTHFPSLVKIPKPWSECLIWQDETMLSGGTGVESKEIDHDIFNGDADKFKLYIGGEPTIPPEGNDMILYYADLKAGFTSNVRPLPDLSSTPATPIVGPLTVSIVSEKTTADGYDWYQITEPVNGYIALTTSYTNFRTATPIGAEYPIKVTVETNLGNVYVATDLVKQ